MKYLLPLLLIAGLATVSIPKHQTLRGVGSSTYIGGYSAYQYTNGNLQIGEFALEPTGRYIGYIATTTILSTTTAKLIDIPPHYEWAKDSVPFIGMTQVAYVGEKYFDTFDVSGKKMKVEVSKSQYDTKSPKTVTPYSTSSATAAK